MEAAFIYVTAVDKSEALEIGRVLVEERLVACVNVLEGITSLYWWEGEIHQESEAVLVAKTKRMLLDDVIERVRSLHSYDCPCVVSWPIETGNRAYLQWIENETK